MTQIVFGQVENYNDVKELEMDLKIDLNFRLDGLEKFKFNDLEADLFLIPEENYMQSVESLELSMNPDGKKDEKAGFMRFKWTKPNSENLKASLKSRVLNKNEIFRIDKKVKYPFVNNDLREYLEETKYIDINEDIKSLARQLAQDTDDLYLISVKVAEWVRKNIEYNLSTLNSEAVFKSSDVLKQGEGVCDELTNLFISLLRSLGIPARFVTGVVYSNLGYKWFNHGWSEVYFPGYGWVPFDVTFGQYGWIDPSHIKLQSSRGSGESSVNYRWHSIGGDVKLDKIELNTIYLSEIEGFRSPVKLNVRSNLQNVGFGSYVPVIVEVENLKDSYVSAFVYLSNAPGFYDEREKVIALKPFEKKSLVFIVEFKGDFKDNFIYSSEIKVNDQFGDSSSVKIQSSKNYEFYGLDKALKFLKNILSREKKQFFDSLDIKCKGDKDNYWSNEIGRINCEFLSQEDNKNVDVCLFDYCKLIDLEGRKKESVEFEVNFSNFENVWVTVENNLFFRKEFLDMKINKIPSIEVSDFDIGFIDYYDDRFVNLALVSNVNVKDLDVKINGYELSFIKELNGRGSFDVLVKGEMVYDGANVEIDFKDEFGNRYFTSKRFNVDVSNIPWYSRMILWFKRLF